MSQRTNKLILAGVLALMFLAGGLRAGNETENQALADAIALYRAEGAEAALPEFERLYREFEAAGEALDQARALRYIGESHWRLGNLEEVRPYLDESLLLLAELDALYEEGKTLNVLGLLEWDFGKYPEALSALGRARKIAFELGKDELAAGALNNMGLVHDELGDYESSLEEYRQAFDLFTKIGDRRGQSNALGNTGGVYLLLGHYGEALGYYERALALSEQMASKPSMTIDHGNIAYCYLGLGRYQDAHDHFDRALELARATGMRHEEAYWQRGKANALIREGKYDLGLENHRVVLATYEDTGARGLLLDALHDLGELYLELGDPVSAETHFRRAMDLARDLGQEQAVTLNLLALGDLQLFRERPDEATALYLQANQRASDAGEVHLQAEASLRLSESQRASGLYDEAAAYARGSLDSAQNIGSIAGEAWALFAMAESELAMEQAGSALESYAGAARVAGSDGDPDLRWQVHYGRARALVLLGQREPAIRELQAAVEIIEGVRDRLREDRFRAGYLKDKYQVYIELVRLQLESGQTEAAFSTAERLRARSFLAQLEREAPAARTAAERRKEVALRERIRQLQENLIEEQEKARSDRRQLALQAFSNELARAERDYQAFLDDLSGRSGARAMVEAPDLDEVRESLLEDEALVEYLVSEDEIVMFVLHGQGLLSFKRTIAREELFTKVRLLRELVQDPGDVRWTRPARSLGATLLDPLRNEPELEAVRHLYLVPHDLLNYLPFALLSADETGDRLLVDDFTLTYLPTAAALVRDIEPRKNDSSLLAMAPAAARLTYAPEEARMVAALFSPASRLLEGGNATESEFKRQAGEFRLLHFATHGYFNRRNPLLSGLQLEADAVDDGRLEVHEILGMDLGARLVTLSACETGLGSGWFGELPVGDDFVGLTRAFLYAGSEAVLASLWEVDDRSTVGLMESFYRHLGSQDTGPGQASALARVQREMRASKDFNHPFYWAPFVLVGQHRNGTARS